MLLIGIITASAQEYKPVNLILMIGDGMGVSHIHAGLTANHGILSIEQFKSIGFSKTHSASNYITDSAAAGTAISSGKKTYNSAIAVNTDTIPIKTILEYAIDKGLGTGLVVTSSLTDATPASFVAHQANRYMLEAIAADYLECDIDVFIGGGKKYFTVRGDSIDLIPFLREKNYQVIFSMDSIKNVSTGKLAGFTADEHNLTHREGRGDMLPEATATAINILKNKTEGFFLMVEGSHIDKVSHSNDTIAVVAEMIDFDKAIGKALEFAKQDGNTLVIVTSDHETGGLSITNGDYKAGEITANWGSFNHTGVMVPVFAYGPGEEYFQGFMENTDLFYKMMAVLGIEPDIVE